MGSVPKTAGSDTQLQGLLDQSLEGNPAAKEALLNHACDRLLKLTRKMFHGQPGLRRGRTVFLSAHPGKSASRSSHGDRLEWLVTSLKETPLVDEWLIPYDTFL